MTGLSRINRMNERTRRVKVLNEQTPFVNRETGGFAQAREPQSGRDCYWLSRIN